MLHLYSVSPFLSSVSLPINHAVSTFSCTPHLSLSSPSSSNTMLPTPTSTPFSWHHIIFFLARFSCYCFCCRSLSRVLARIFYCNVFSARPQAWVRQYFEYPSAEFQNRNQRETEAVHRHSPSLDTRHTISISRKHRHCSVVRNLVQTDRIVAGTSRRACPDSPASAAAAATRQPSR